MILTLALTLYVSASWYNLRIRTPLQEVILAKRIDSLVPGEKVRLKVHPSTVNEGYEFDTVFIGIDASQGRDKRVARFGETPGGHPTVSLYRFDGRWAIASDARRVTLVA